MPIGNRDEAKTKLIDSMASISLSSFSIAVRNIFTEFTNDTVSKLREIPTDNEDTFRKGLTYIISGLKASANGSLRELFENRTLDNLRFTNSADIRSCAKELRAHIDKNPQLQKNTQIQYILLIADMHASLTEQKKEYELGQAAVSKSIPAPPAKRARSAREEGYIPEVPSVLQPVADTKRNSNANASQHPFWGNDKHLDLVYVLMKTDEKEFGQNKATILRALSPHFKAESRAASGNKKFIGEIHIPANRNFTEDEQKDIGEKLNKLLIALKDDFLNIGIREPELAKFKDAFMERLHNPTVKMKSP